MSLIHIVRDDRVIGQYTAREVAAGLASGEFLTSDTAWRVGRRGWAPLAEWPEFAGLARTEPAVAPAPAVAETPAPPVGGDAPPTLIVTPPLPASPPAGAPVAGPGPARSAVAAREEEATPWEREFARDRVWSVLAETVRLVLTAPGRVFADPAPAAAKAGRAVLFVLAVGGLVLTPVRLLVRLGGGTPVFWASSSVASSPFGRLGLCVSDALTLAPMLLLFTVGHALFLQLALPVAGVKSAAFVPLYRVVAYHGGAMLALAAPVVLLAAVSKGLAGLLFAGLVVGYAAGVVRGLRLAYAVPAETAWSVVLPLLLCCGWPLF